MIQGQPYDLIGTAYCYTNCSGSDSYTWSLAGEPQPQSNDFSPNPTTDNQSTYAPETTTAQTALGNYQVVVSERGTQNVDFHLVVGVLCSVALDTCPAIEIDDHDSGANLTTSNIAPPTVQAFLSKLDNLVVKQHANAQPSGALSKISWSVSGPAISSYDPYSGASPAQWAPPTGDPTMTSFAIWQNQSTTVNVTATLNGVALDASFVYSPQAITVLGAGQQSQFTALPIGTNIDLYGFGIGVYASTTAAGFDLADTVTLPQGDSGRVGILQLINTCIGADYGSKLNSFNAKFLDTQAFPPQDSPTVPNGPAFTTIPNSTPAKVSFEDSPGEQIIATTGSVEFTEQYVFDTYLMYQDFSSSVPGLWIPLQATKWGGEATAQKKAIVDIPLAFIVDTTVPTYTSTDPVVYPTWPGILTANSGFGGAFACQPVPLSR